MRGAGESVRRKELGVRRKWSIKSFGLFSLFGENKTLRSTCKTKKTGKKDRIGEA